MDPTFTIKMDNALVFSDLSTDLRDSKALFKKLLAGGFECIRTAPLYSTGDVISAEFPTQEIANFVRAVWNGFKHHFRVVK